MSSELSRRAEEILRRFGQTWTMTWEDLKRPDADQVLKSLIQESAPAMQERLIQEFFEDGPLKALLEEAGLQEIILNGPDDIWIERNGTWSKHPDRFLTATTFKNFIDRVCAEARFKVDLASPFADGRWRGFRAHLTMAPLTHCSFHLSLRLSPTNPWTFEKLLEASWATPQQMEILKNLLADRKNFLMIGPTGSGKTSVLGACLKELPESERMVILEDTDELPRPNSASTKLLTRSNHTPGLPEVALSDLVRQSLRMRPERLILGEVRGPEAKDLLLALATGHRGSLGTMHASDPRQALLRLEMLVQMGAPQWSLQSIRQLLHLSVEGLIVCGNKNGHRRLEGIYRVAALESFGLLLESML